MANQREVRVETEAQRDEADDVLDDRAPEAVGPAEFAPRSLQEYLIQDCVLLRDIEIGAGSCSAVDNVSLALIKKVQRYIALILNDPRLFLPCPGQEVFENFVC